MSTITEPSRTPDWSAEGLCDSLYDFLKSHFLFAGLVAADFDRLAAHITAVSLQKGDVLFHRGDQAGFFYFVDSGLIELSLISPTGDRNTLEVVAPGGIFAEAIAFLQEQRYPASAEALRDSILYRIPNRRYAELIRSNRDAAMRLIADVSRQLHARVREIERLTLQNARTRLTSYLADHLVEPPDDDQATARLDLPRHVIASRLSIRPETLSRLLGDLSDEGIVTIDDRVVFIHSMARLRPYD